MLGMCARRADLQSPRSSSTWPSRTRSLNVLLASLLKAPEGESPYAVIDDAEVPHLFERATEPPGIAEPTGEWRDRGQALERFQESGRRLSDLADKCEGDMRMKGAPHPIFGPLDGVQWAQFAAAHNERHRSEIIGLAMRAATAKSPDRA